MWWLDIQFAPSSGKGAGGASVIDAGDRAPEFTLPAHDGGEVSSADYYGKQPLVLFYYPKAHTSG
jgi:peroxiredoxin Q/BCP